MPTLILISDTHNQHNQLTIPDGDIIIHAGDATNMGERPEMVRFLDWYEGTSPTHKIYVSGNHDFLCEEEPEEIRLLCEERGIHYLCCESITLEGLRIYGTPYQPVYGNWAFNASQPELEKLAAKIPECDVLVSHGPPYGILDEVLHPRQREDAHVGDKFLLRRIWEIRPKLVHVGHIHESRGQLSKDGVTFVNSAVCSLRHNMVREPFTVQL